MAWNLPDFFSYLKRGVPVLQKPLQPGRRGPEHAKRRASQAGAWRPFLTDAPEPGIKAHRKTFNANAANGASFSYTGPDA